MTNHADTPGSTASNQPLFQFEDKKQRNLFYSLIWVILVCVVVVPLASFLAPFWLVLQIVEPLLPVIRDITNLLEKLLTWPRKMGLAIFESRETFPNPFEDDMAIFAGSSTPASPHAGATV
ncbi:hypothetical protein ACA910_016030 [Epithemia clementina (nom. ined.)]